MISRRQLGAGDWPRQSIMFLAQLFIRILHAVITFLYRDGSKKTKKKWEGAVSNPGCDAHWASQLSWATAQITEQRQWFLRPNCTWVCYITHCRQQQTPPLGLQRRLQWALQRTQAGGTAPQARANPIMIRLVNLLCPGVLLGSLHPGSQKHCALELSRAHCDSTCKNTVFQT